MKAVSEKQNSIVAKFLVQNSIKNQPQILDGISARHAISLFLLVIHCLLFTPFDAQALLVQVNAQAGPLGQLNETEGVYQPLIDQGLIALASFSSDYEDINYTAMAHAAGYVSDGSSSGLFGVEPMAHAAASTAGKVGATGPIGTAVASSSVTVKHRVQAKTNLDPNIIYIIPLFLSYKLDTSIDGPSGASYSSAAFSIIGPGIFENNSRSVANGGTASGTLTFNVSTAAGILDYNIGVTAGAGADYGYYTDDDNILRVAGGGAQAVADSFLFIDPNWEYFSLFEVLQESSRVAGEWVEVSRTWQDEPPTTYPVTPVPGPAITLLLLKKKK